MELTKEQIKKIDLFLEGIGIEYIDIRWLQLESAMTDLFENPMGLMGFEFIEFAAPQPGVLEPSRGFDDVVHQ